ncbi:hypothetical protein SAMN04487977_101444 [Treponema bryantii]|uniref:Lipoprotein n=1 Tax=Treponema bryantii TaxID=163 RepID=A0A1H9ARH1_9SPIR|nr:hypothetical protein [Treponema bryantii]SEP79384.1 hypothetical protein SAMN04487977_101444 [Treponema bryantii]
MKKLFIGILCISLLSCKSPHNSTVEPPSEEQTAIPRSEWDSDNIAFENTSKITTTNSFYPRTEGTSGIIGSYYLSEERYEGMTGAEFTYQYDFYDNGYCHIKKTGWNTKAFTTPFSSEGTHRYKIIKFADDYYKVSYLSDNGVVKSSEFFQVSNDGLHLTYAINRDGVLIYANQND